MVGNMKSIKRVTSKKFTKDLAMHVGRSDYHSCNNCSAVGPHGSLISWDGYYYEVRLPNNILGQLLLYLVKPCQQRIIHK